MCTELLARCWNCGFTRHVHWVRCHANILGTRDAIQALKLPERPDPNECEGKTPPQIIVQISPRACPTDNSGCRALRTQVKKPPASRPREGAEREKVEVKEEKEKEKEKPMTEDWRGMIEALRRERLDMISSGKSGAIEDSCPSAPRQAPSQGPIPGPAHEPAPGPSEQQPNSMPRIQLQRISRPHTVTTMKVHRKSGKPYPEVGEAQPKINRSNMGLPYTLSTIDKFSSAPVVEAYSTPSLIRRVRQGRSVEPVLTPVVCVARPTEGAGERSPGDGGGEGCDGTKAADKA